jgi:hypothetical protein
VPLPEGLRNLEAAPPAHPERIEWAIGRLLPAHPAGTGALSAAFGTVAQRGCIATMDIRASAQPEAEASEEAEDSAGVEAVAVVAAAVVVEAVTGVVEADADRSEEKPMPTMNAIYLKDISCRSSRFVAVGLVLAVALLQAAPRESQRTFATPQEAIQAIIDAAEHNDAAALLQLFGPDGKDILESGDPAQDKDSRAEFARSAHEKLQIDQDPTNPDRITFMVGEQDWPFPVPVVRKDGKWQLDPISGRLEILARRVGRNELNTMELCRGYVEAQLAYASEDHYGDGILQYAQSIASSAGKHDGLYSEDASQYLVPKRFVTAASASKPEPYHGYYFRVLKSQGPAARGGAFDYVVRGKMIGGFALVAWPAEYGVSGVQTFIINHEGLLYGKDLGVSTAALARQMSRFNPDKSWRRIDLE